MSRSHRLAALALLAAGAAGLAAPAPTETDVTVKDRATFLPLRKYQPLPGKVVGVLVSDVGGVMGHDGRGGPPDALGFSRDAQSYRWVYVPVKDNPTITDLDVRVGEKGEKTVVYPSLSIASAQAVKPWGVTRPYALVEVEVNDGRGAPAEEGFVATRMKVLDGSREYPLDMTAVLGKLRKAYKGYLEEKKDVLDGALAEARKKALKDRKPTGPRETTELVYLTWLAEQRRLRVAFRTMVTDGAYTFGPANDRGRPLPDSPRRQAVRFGTAFGIEFGRAYEVSKDGKVVRTLTLPPESFQQELRPPARFRPPAGKD
jgi:hypothetical protein